MKREERNNEEEIFNNQLEALKLGCLLKLFFYDVNLVTEEGSLYYIELDGVMSIIRNNLIGYPYKMKDYEIELLRDDTLKNFLDIEDIQKTIETFKLPNFDNFESEPNESRSQYEIFIDEINILMNLMYKNIIEDKSDHILTVSTNKILVSTPISETTESSVNTSNNNSNNSSSVSNHSSPNINDGFSTPPVKDREIVDSKLTQDENNDSDNETDLLGKKRQITQISYSNIKKLPSYDYDYDYDDDELVDINSGHSFNTRLYSPNPRPSRGSSTPANLVSSRPYSRGSSTPTNLVSSRLYSPNPRPSRGSSTPFTSVGGSYKRKTRRKKKKSKNKTRKH